MHLIKGSLLLKGAESELAGAVALIEAVKAGQPAGRLTHWSADYPGESVIQNDLRQGNCWIYHIDKRMGALIVLDENGEPAYASVNWLFTAAPVLYMHRLCVHPEFQDRGIATQLVKFADDFARKKAYKVLRLDVYKYNPKALHLYEKSGYEIRGLITRGEYDFYAMEKRVSGKRGLPGR